MRTYGGGGWEGLLLGLGLGLGLGIRRVVRMRKKGMYRGKRGVGGKGKNNKMNQTTLPYVNL